jgi:RimJ/RimL family protein N-acetyltransferase
MIIGKKAALLPFDEIYLPAVQRWVNQPDVRKGTGTEGPVSNFEHRQWYENLMMDRTQRTFVIGENSGGVLKPAGLIGLKNINGRARHAEYWIYIGDIDSRRKGLAAEATNLILGFGFKTLGLHRIFLIVMENNIAAINLYRKLGFVEEGTAREHVFFDGCFQNMISFSLLQSEFDQLSRD